MKIPKYPEEFYSFINGAKISNETINEWIQVGIKSLEKNPDRDYYCCSSGDTEVYISKYIDEYYISVSKNHSTTRVDREDL